MVGSFGSEPGSLGSVDQAIAVLGQRLEAILVGLPGWLLDGTRRFYWIYLVTFVVLGAISYLRYYAARDPRGGVGALFRFLFPLDTYRHPSALVDYQLFLANRFFSPSTLLSRLLLGPLSITYVALLTESALAHLSGESLQATGWTTATLAIFVVSSALVQDFATYVVHALHHRWPLLWEFHKVHHSAQVLTPITLYRKHPVYSVLSRAANIAIVGPFQGLIAFLFVGAADPATLFGANAVFALFYLFGANLRHSHIWLSYGPMLSHVFISPAQHQIHHSKAERHWDKNFGEVFALWDWMFGTLHVPGREREEIEFGVAGAEGQEHATLWQAYVVPFANCGRMIGRRVARSRRLPNRNENAGLATGA